MVLKIQIFWSGENWEMLIKSTFSSLVLGRAFHIAEIPRDAEFIQLLRRFGADGGRQRLDIADELRTGMGRAVV